jgi:hypothetical protein
MTDLYSIREAMPGAGKIFPNPKVPAFGVNGGFPWKKMRLR